MFVHEALAADLRRRKVALLFGLAGDANLFMIDCFTHEGGRYIAAAHEANAVLMALGHARVSGEVGVATLTHGPALTNAITALVSGVRARIPAVIMVGDTAAEARGHLQNIDQRELVRDTGADFVQLRAPATLAEDLALAFRTARLNQRPVVFNMPADFQWQECSPPTLEEQVISAPTLTPGGADFDNAIGIIAAARAPVILAGRGAIAPEHRAALIRLAERIGAPLATTLQARELFTGHPFNLGIFGTLTTEPALEALAKTDCVIAFGASLNRFTTAEGSLLKGRRVIQIDADAGQIGRNARVDAGLAGDPALMADLMVEWLDKAEIPASGSCTPELARRLAEWRLPATFARQIPEGTVDLRAALVAIEAALPRPRVIATDGGRFLGEAWRIFPVGAPADFVSPIGFAEIGSGMALAIGAAAAAADRPTVLITGDGGFMLGGLNELFTAVREGLDLIVVMCNDNGYGAEHVQLRDRNRDPGLALLHWPDFAPLAAALGMEGVTIRHADDIAVAVAAIKGRKGPILVDIKVDPDNVAPIAF